MSLTGPVMEFLKLVQEVGNNNYPEVSVHTSPLIAL